MTTAAPEKQTMSQTPWYILGAGAIGCLWAGYLKLAGFPVVLITREQSGPTTIQLTFEDQQYSIVLEQLSLQDLNTSSLSIQRLLVSTKAQQTISALEAIEKHIAEDATLLLMQNGMASEAIHRLLPSQTLHIGITTDGAYRTAPRSVVHAGKGQTLIGSPDTGEAIFAELPSQYLNIKSCNNIVQKQWEKLAINCAINGLTVIFQCRNGELLSKPEALARMEALCQEIIPITEQLDIVLPSANDLFQQTKQTLQLTADNFSSMYQDIKQGQPTEIDFINGYLVEQAKRLGIDCPENQRLLTEIKTIEKTL